MKKISAIVLVLALMATLAGTLNGCQKDAGPLKVPVDLQDTLQIYLENNERVFEQSLNLFASALRLRTEIMAGSGPDVFLVGSATGYDSSEEYGQVHLPLVYSFPITLFPKSLAEHTPLCRHDLGRHAGRRDPAAAICRQHLPLPTVGFASGHGSLRPHGGL